MAPGNKTAMITSTIAGPVGTLVTSKDGTYVRCVFKAAELAAYTQIPAGTAMHIGCNVGSTSLPAGIAFMAQMKSLDNDFVEMRGGVGTTGMASGSCDWDSTHFIHT